VGSHADQKVYLINTKYLYYYAGTVILLSSCPLLILNRQRPKKKLKLKILYELQTSRN